MELQVPRSLRAIVHLGGGRERENERTKKGKKNFMRKLWTKLMYVFGLVLCAIQKQKGKRNRDHGLSPAYIVLG